MLLKLPAEILREIAQQVTDKEDLKSLCEVSTYLYSIAIPILYEQVTIVSKDEEHLENMPVVQTLCTSRNLLGHIKNIEFASPFHIFRGFGRCSHNRRLPDIDTEEDLLPENSCFIRLSANVVTLLEGCPNNNLQSFTWGLGTCIPQEIIGSSGLLTLKQKQIESMQLITAGSCYGNLTSQSPMNLSGFTRLKKLSWKGMKSENDWETLKNTLKQSSHQLVELELDFVEWVRLKSGLFTDDKPGSSFTRPKPPQGTPRMFPALQVLSLSEFMFESDAMYLAYAFDFALLRSLKLNYSCWKEFLLGSRLNRPSRLKCLEIGIDIPIYDGEAEKLIPEFLQSFNGLEQLALLTCSPSPTLDIWRAALHHKSTLKAFVHHQRDYIQNDDLGFEEYCDNPNLSLALVEEEVAGWTENPSENPLSEFNLEFLGICLDPKLLERVLAPIAKTSSLRVLHIRQSPTHFQFASWGLHDDRKGTDESGAVKLHKILHDFAQWAFGPEGLPSLKVIVYGDFSFQGRYAETHVFLYRNAELHQMQEQCDACETYHHFSRGDWQKDLLDKYSSSLAACPFGHLMQ
ncbi:hypothetical protein DM02DRAFT_676170 [Periconia macrospinosa]|uniref:F-box domain-containing protein n=1 Tax=Periconia macrospinosa TaxID=97972 RepID=A0A2V1D8V7_9PLEO|nr:hypothetical protein DM02DRAFT_676170 [Periconia macrospinosa]